ncbi:MAG TPA: YheU family protein [Steroidobacteraceae bacterium]|nr:YheU family protein [Steroidobacteraceae bacterium]
MGDRAGMEDEAAEPAEPVEVPHTELSAELLNAVIESFVLREGTDYGEKEFSLEDKVARVVAQLKRGEAKIVFDPESSSVTIVVG